MAIPRSSLAANKRLGRNISRLRQNAGLTQDKFAELLEITPRYLQKLENGMHAPSLPILINVRKKLGAGWAELLDGL